MSDINSILQKELDLSFFRENSFVRRKCRVCGSYFWATNKNQSTCGDQPCNPFSFIDNPPTEKPFSISEMRNVFLSFFEKRGHKIIKPYPVVARWRKDIYLTIASIADFQPHVTSGLVPPPANPLVISQPSIRLNDLNQVGVSGRHLSIFEMMGHHAFNSQNEVVYWTEETVRYCNDFLLGLGIEQDRITYKESIWEGGGNAGPCLEVLVDGLEVATLVFMSLVEGENGDYEIEGRRYSPMNMKVVDTGYGLERLTWLSQGTRTIYDVLYPDIIHWIIENSKEIDKKIVYALADHTKCLAFMLGDGIVPSNIKAGYLARLMIRRSLRFLRRLGLNCTLYDIVEMHVKYLSKDFPHLNKAKTRIEEILKIETDKYNETMVRGERLIHRFLKEKKNIDTNTLVNLYDSQGIHPDLVKKIAEKEGIDIKIPENFDSLVAELHSHEKEIKEIMEKIPQNIPPTRLLYYEDAYKKKFQGKVLWVEEKHDKIRIALDQTLFYPEGGGQPSDTGFLYLYDKRIKVRYVEKVGNVVLHHVDEEIPLGSEIYGEIDWNRRYSLMKHHTGTHLINGACRAVLGNHIWQAGSQLDINDARFDFSHYRALSYEDIKRIESTANKFIEMEVEIEKRFMDRDRAEKLYGFRLYQGGVPKSEEIRVVNIPDIDTEACGGTHLNNTKEVERIRIIKTERIQDGIDRLIFVAGKENVERIKNREDELWNNILNILDKHFIILDRKTKDTRKDLQDIARIFSVPIDKLESTIIKFTKDISTKKEKMKAKDTLDACGQLFKTWKKTRKEKRKISDEFINDIKKKAERFENVWLIIIDNPNFLKSLDPTIVAGKITEEKNYVICINDGNGITIAASKDVDIDLRSIANKAGRILGGGGGGKEKMVRCGGPNKEKLNIAIEEIRRELELTLKKK